MGKGMDAGMGNGCRKRQMMGKGLDAGMGYGCRKRQMMGKGLDVGMGNGYEYVCGTRMQNVIMTPHPNPLLKEEREFRCSTLLKENRETKKGAHLLRSISSPFSRERMKVRVN